MLGDCLDWRGIGFYLYVPLINELAFNLPQIEFLNEAVIKLTRQLVDKEIDQLDFQSTVDKDKNRYLPKLTFIQNMKSVCSLNDKDLEIIFLKSKDSDEKVDMNQFSTTVFWAV